MKHIGIFVPFHLRGGDGANIRTNFELLNTLPYDVVVCGSEGSYSEEWAAKFEYLNYCEVEQAKLTTSSGGDEELRRKFNRSLHALATLDSYHWYVFVGANDIVSYEFWKYLDQLGTDHPAVVGVGVENPLFMVDIGTDRRTAININYKQPVALLPGVNAFNRTALEMCEWRPYQRHGDEIGMERMAVDMKWIIDGGPGWVCAMKKKGIDLNSYDHALSGTHKTRPITERENLILSTYGI